MESTPPNEVRRDPTKWLSLLISVSALTLGSFNYWDSHKGQLQSRDVNRPALVAEKTVVIRNNDVVPHELMVFIHFKNVGRSTAKLLTTDSVILTEDSACKTTGNVLKSFYERELELPPSVSESLPFIVPLRPDCTMVKFLGSGSFTVHYADLSGQTFSQEFTVPVDELEGSVDSK